MFKFIKFMIPFFMILFSLHGYAKNANVKNNDVTAIDIALEPDATMIKHAEDVNMRLRKIYPKGFALDATHKPHISILQRYVYTKDLDKVYAAIGNILSKKEVPNMSLKAHKYYYLPWENIGLAGIVIEPTENLLSLQEELIKAVAPFTAKTGTAAAFFTTPKEPNVNQPTIKYVEKFVPDETGKNFNPHVTVGVAKQETLKNLLKQKFDEFTFSPVAASVYQMGNFGTARKKLQEWDYQQ